MLRNFVVLLVNCLIITAADAQQREKRAYFVYPMGGQFKIVIAVAIPVKLGLKQSMAFGFNLQFQYAVATNISQIKDYPPLISRMRVKRERPRSDRAISYLGLELIMERYGLIGRPCLLKMICENALGSFHHAGNGLYGQLLHIFLSPDYGDGEVDTDLDQDYVDAQKAGRFGVDCDSLYLSCPYGNSILDMVSFLEGSN